MSAVFEVVKNKLAEELSQSGYELKDEFVRDNAENVTFLSQTDAVRVSYDKGAKKFFLYRGNANLDESSFSQAQTYFFDEEGGDSEREAKSVALDFAETLSSQSSVSRARISRAAQAKSSGSEDNVTAPFFVNRIPTYFSECRLPLISHKEHYETLLPVKFCEEVVTVCLSDALRRGDKRLGEFLGFLSSSYENGDLDTKSIIIQIILNSISKTEWGRVEDMLSEQLRKAWVQGRRYIGKEVKPESVSAIKKIAKAQAKLGR